MGITRVISYQVPRQKSALAVLARRSYKIIPDARPEPLREHLPFVMEPVYADSINSGAGPRLLMDSDRFCPEKPCTDVLVLGSAYAPNGPVSELLVSVSVGAAYKQLRITGDRKIVLESGGRIAFTKPEPFERMEVSMDHAFGGRDTYAEAQMSAVPAGFGRRRSGLSSLREPPSNPKEDGYGISYPRNISGRGFFIDMDRERLEGARLPNIEDPEDLLRPERLLIRDPLDWMDLPVAAGFGPIDYLTFPRALYVLPHAANAPKMPVHEVKRGVVSKADMDAALPLGAPPNPRLYNCAPAGLGSARLQGGERVVLTHLHPVHARLSFELPADKPRMLMEPPGCAVSELETRLQTVWIEPDEMRLTLIWAGALETAARFPQAMADTIRHAAVFA